jgi:plastocyanin/mono/diheme cytochrome c family protein
VVIIGLVALATVLTVYIAREPDRRGTEAAEQEEVAIVRGTELYITFCLQCHGPAGLGSAADEENQRIGPPLDTEFYTSDDPAQQQAAEDLIYYRIIHGVPSDPRIADKLMPSFAQDLNEEQMRELVTLITSGNWNYVYNTAVTETGSTVAQAECDDGDGEGEYCGDLEEAPPVYPTAPPPEAVEEDADAGEDASEGDDEVDDTDEAAGDAVTQLEADDPYEWSQYELSLAPGDTIEVTNVGFTQHDFTVDALGISQDLPNGEPVTITIPEDAEPGDYEFYCSVPGHREGGMIGTLTIEAP